MALQNSTSRPVKTVSFHQNWSAYAFLAPALVILFLSLLLPAVATLLMSFTDVFPEADEFHRLRQLYQAVQ